MSDKSGCLNFLNTLHYRASLFSTASKNLLTRKNDLKRKTMKLSSYLTVLVLAMAIISLTSCYRMPTDDDYCIVPTTNNPSVTYEKSSFLPNFVGK